MLKDREVVYNLVNFQYMIPLIRKGSTFGDDNRYGIIFSRDVKNRVFTVCLENIFISHKIESKEFSADQKISYNSLEDLLSEWRVD